VAILIQRVEPDRRRSERVPYPLGQARSRVCVSGDRESAYAFARVPEQRVPYPPKPNIARRARFGLCAFPQRVPPRPFAQPTPLLDSRPAQLMMAPWPHHARSREGAQCGAEGLVLGLFSVPPWPL